MYDSTPSSLSAALEVPAVNKSRANKAARLRKQSVIKIPISKLVLFIELSGMDANFQWKSWIERRSNDISVRHTKCRVAATGQDRFPIRCIVPTANFAHKDFAGLLWSRELTSTGHPLGDRSCLGRPI